MRERKSGVKGKLIEQHLVAMFEGQERDIQSSWGGGKFVGKVQSIENRTGCRTLITALECRVWHVSCLYLLWPYKLGLNVV